MIERERRQIDDTPHEGKCIVCGRPFTLWYNGGELDHEYCCDVRYALEHGPLFFVVHDYRKEAGQTSE